MKTVLVTGPGTTAVVDVPQPTAGPADVLVRMRACGICGSDGFYVEIGGIPPRQGKTPLGHEPAGEVVEVGADVTGITVGDHVVINPIASREAMIGSGGASGALSEYLLIENAVLGTSLAIMPKHVPFYVAALNEPMAVARHAVNRTNPKPGDKVVISAPARSASARPSATRSAAPPTWSWSTSCPPAWRRPSPWAPTP